MKQIKKKENKYNYIQSSKKKIIGELSKQKQFLEEFTFEKYIENFTETIYPDYVLDNLTYIEKLTSYNPL